ncbi:hypothetical protein SAMN05216368_11216 [Cryobacterium flavum]|uniref:Uncharacterized protein n=1 Tax=Cryobacterium flavum TaxID=1424659 RepID=A0A4R8UUC6_9MICO|nr:hypothetical protein [Cryobacterium flavum]TFB72041.1 hypothetical protein E3O21_19610 [Cryobacterium flavum]SDO18593.1 hypothetical protein SAMN05216368_11216 [Cryobacterium flavum]
MSLAQIEEKARDRLIAVRSSYALVVTLFVMVAVIPLGLAFNVIMVVVLKIPGNMEPGPGVTNVDRLAGTLPYPIPAWTALLCALSLAALLKICWKRSRQQMVSAPGAKLILQISPMFIALLSIIGSFGSAACAMYYPPSDGWFSWWWVNIAAFAAVAAVAFWHGNRRPQKKKKRRGAPRKPQNA